MRNTEMASISHVKLYLTMNVMKVYNTLCANCRISSGELFFQLIHTKFNLINSLCYQKISAYLGYIMYTLCDLIFSTLEINTAT